MTFDIKTALGKIGNRENLTGEEMRAVMTAIMSGETSLAQTGGFLMGMRVKGETVTEIAAAVSIMKAKMVPVTAPADAMDIVGTGGDGAGTYNISTATAFVVAAAGVPVAKHGNRALSSKSGSAEALQALGIKLDLTPDQIGACIRDAGIGFMFAPAHHPAMRYVGPVRAELGTRTMFNLLGPQANPAGVKKYLIGVFDRAWVEPIAAALQANRVTDAWVVHGHSGLDEISTTGPTFVASIKDDSLTSFEIAPEDAGLMRAELADLIGGTPEENAASLRAVLSGAEGAYRDIVLMNAAGALIVAGKADTLKAGVALAEEMIGSGAALATLDDLVAVSNGFGA